jgi:hypothetical protein
MSTQSWLMLAGVVLVLLGALIRWRVSRYDLKDAAIDSAWMLARGRRTAENPTALEAKYRDIREERTWGRRAKKAAGTVAGHFAAQVLGGLSLVLIAAGLLALVAGFLWR